MQTFKWYYGFLDREMVTETLNSLKNTLDEALDRAAQGSKVLA